MPASERLTISTWAACSSTERLRCSTPMPPWRAIAMAIRASVTVSIALETSGILSRDVAGQLGGGVGLARDQVRGVGQQQHVVVGQPDQRRTSSRNSAPGMVDGRVRCPSSVQAFHSPTRNRATGRRASRRQLPIVVTGDVAPVPAGRAVRTREERLRGVDPTAAWSARQSPATSPATPPLAALAVAVVVTAVDRRRGGHVVRVLGRWPSSSGWSARPWSSWGRWRIGRLPTGSLVDGASGEVGGGGSDSLRGRGRRRRVVGGGDVGRGTARSSAGVAEVVALVDDPGAAGVEPPAVGTDGRRRGWSPAATGPG